eukprot:Blabericola_migrator_1__2813@NODE_1803_length_3775_cov_69_714132_g1160_i0_p2_GENE_NODE_1803_length_3775_cov_69_714132_g1160_i0NODE_1803_length_3775_cov_69_714132_g1160_i0_p2_ORF_typecomplete_len101_score10_89_NODE_1803_length_3775_cov_69_714132_g1160_i0493795
MLHVGRSLIVAIQATREVRFTLPSTIDEQLSPQSPTMVLSVMKLREVGTEVERTDNNTVVMTAIVMTQCVGVQKKANSNCSGKRMLKSDSLMRGVDYESV